MGRVVSGFERVFGFQQLATGSGHLYLRTQSGALTLYIYAYCVRTGATDRVRSSDDRRNVTWLRDTIDRYKRCKTR